MPNPTTFDTDSDDFKTGARQYAIEMMRQRPDIFEDDLFITELTSDDKERENDEKN